MDVERTKSDKKSLYDSFGDKIDKDVIDMVYTECDKKVLQTIDYLVSMTGEMPKIFPLAESQSIAKPIPADQVSARGNVIHSIEMAMPHDVEMSRPVQPHAFEDDAVFDATIATNGPITTPGIVLEETDGRPDAVIPGHKVMYLMRGLPGCGKSYAARKLKGKCGVILSTDDYFERDGRYMFNPQDLQEAHAWNQTRAKIATDNHVTPVIIDNTNTQSWEMQPYASMAARNGYEIKICEPNTQWSWDIAELARRNSHGVTKEKIAIMLQRYDHGLTVDEILNRQRSIPTVSNGDRPQMKEASSTVASTIRSPHAAKFAPRFSTRPKSFSHYQSGSPMKDKSARLGMRSTGSLKTATRIQQSESDVLNNFARLRPRLSPVEHVMPDVADPDITDVTPIASDKLQPSSVITHDFRDPVILSAVLQKVDLTVPDTSHAARNDEDMYGPSTENVQFLQDCFPDFDRSLLSAVLLSNNGNVQQSCDELLRDTIFIDVEDGDSSQGEQAQFIMRDTHRRDVMTQTEPDFMEIIDTGSVLATKSGVTHGLVRLSSETKVNQLVVNIDQSLCLQLKEFFGNASEDVGWDIGDTAVHLPLDVGEQLFHALESAVKTEKTKKQLLEKQDEVYAQQLELLDKFKQDVPIVSVADSVRDIRQQDTADGKRTWGNTTFGSAADYRNAEREKKRQKILHAFPGVDEEALLQILEANGYDLDVSMKLAASSCGISLNTVAQDDNASEYVIVPSRRSPRPSRREVDPPPDTHSYTSPIPSLGSSHGITGPSRFQLPENPEYHDYRAEAQIHFDMRKRYLNEAAKAYGEKRGVVAQYYAEKARDQYNKMQEANTRAAVMILKRNQEMISNNGELDALDIHGLHVTESVIVVDHYLELAYEDGKEKVMIITGKGLHSRGGKARLKPAIMNLLRRRNYRYADLGGHFIVYLY